MAVDPNEKLRELIAQFSAIEIIKSYTVLRHLRVFNRRISQKADAEAGFVSRIEEASTFLRRLTEEDICYQLRQPASSFRGNLQTAIGVLQEVADYNKDKPVSDNTARAVAGYRDNLLKGKKILIQIADEINLPLPAELRRGGEQNRK